MQPERVKLFIIEINLQEEKKENEIEVSNETTENNTESNDSSEKSNEQLDVQETETTKQEEVKQDDEKLEEYSKGVQSRIAKLTRKMREAERQKEEAITFANSMKENSDRLEKKMSTLDKSYVKEFESRVTTNMDAARQALRVAIEAGDVDGQVKAQEQMARLAQDASRLGALKDISEAPTEKEVTTPTYQQQPQQSRSDPKAEEWAAKNTWFGNDSAMTHTALDLHKVLVEEEGYDPKSDEYYEEVEKRIRLEFPHKFDKIDSNSTERVKPTQNVASAKRSASTGRRKTVKLTPSQVAIAKRLGVPLEDYAKQLKITEGA